MPRLEEEACSVPVDRTELARSGSCLVRSHLDPPGWARLVYQIVLKPVFLC